MRSFCFILVAFVAASSSFAMNTQNTDAQDEPKVSNKWNKQGEAERLAWQYFENVLAPQIVADAVANRSTLFELYVKLVQLRARAEWVKKFFRKSGRDFSEELVQELLKTPMRKASKSYGGFTEGDMAENTTSPEWTEAVRNYFSAFTKTDGFTSVEGWDEYIATIGLSTVSTVGSRIIVSHPPGKWILHDLEPTYQAMLDTTDFFHFLRLSSKLIFTLSNFPQIENGSLSVNSWLINGLARAKFDVLEKYFHSWQIESRILKTFLSTPRSSSRRHSSIIPPRCN